MQGLSVYVHTTLNEYVYFHGLCLWHKPCPCKVVIEGQRFVMISITSHYFDESLVSKKHGTQNNLQQNVQPQKVELSWGQVGKIAGSILFVISGLIGLLYDNLKDELHSINGRLDSSISKSVESQKSQGESLARLEASFKGLDRRIELLEKPHYESKAKALGFKNPQIIAASLQAEAKFESKIRTGTGLVLWQYTVLSYNPARKELTLSVDVDMQGKVGTITGGIFQNNLIKMTVEVGTVKPVPMPFHIEGVNFPKVYVQVLEIPSINRAILAIGEKSNSGDTIS